MKITNAFTSKLALNVPLIVAPMAGGPSSIELVVASCEAGALGSIGGAYMTPEALGTTLTEIRKRTRAPYNLNLFAPRKYQMPNADDIDRAVRHTEKIRGELALERPNFSPPYEENFDRQFEVVLQHKPRVFSFVFGALDKNYMRELRRNDIYTVGTATTLDEAMLLEESGVDAIVAQGIEAGGHRGIFNDTAADPNIAMLDLVTRIRSSTQIPVIAAGGIMNTFDIKRALAQGAAAVQMGTAFLLTTEAGTSDPYRQKLLDKPKRETRLSRAYSGRLARGLVNRLMSEVERDPSAILPFPAQNQFTQDIRITSAKRGSAEFLSLWCGTGQGSFWQGATKDLIADLFNHEF